MRQKLKDWAAGKYRPGLDILVPYILIACMGFVFWDCIDTDSYYMMAQGREILSSGIPMYNTHTFYENFRIVVQQYPYCVAEYLASLVPGNTGLWLFMIIQALLLFHVARKFIERWTPDKWLSSLGAIIICIVANQGYFYTLRPENLTLILLLLECMALENYKETGRKKWLLALPALAWAEANAHGSMWPFHICIYLAYAVPMFWPKNFNIECPVEDSHVKTKPEFIIAGLSMLPAMLLNPYGLEMLLYPVRSMQVFLHVPIIEQQATEFTSTYGIMNVILFIALALLVWTKNIDSVSFYMCSGLILLSCVNYHCSMFLPIVKLFMIGCLLRIYYKHKPAKTSDLIPNGIKLLLWPMCAVMMLFGAWQLAISVPDIDKQPDMDPAIDYILENQQPGENILNVLDTGPTMLYRGITGIHSDSRPELMLKSINKEWDAWLEYSWFRNGILTTAEKERYGDIQGYMDAHNIQFIVDAPIGSAFVYLQGWLKDNPDWVRAELDDPYGTCEFAVWIRSDRNNNK